MRFYIYSLLAVLGLGGCFIPASSDFPPIISTPSASAIFQQADQLRYQQDYSTAALAYEELLRQGEMSAFDSLYAINQLLYSQLIWNQLGGVEEWFDEAQTLVQRLTDIPLVLLADHHYNQGRYFFLQNQRDSALQLTHQALKASYLAYPKGHLKQAQTLNLLALIHFKDGNLTDSIHYYALQANDVFINHTELSPYDWENDYVQGYASLLYRAHERGEYYCKTALEKMAQLSVENSWLVARIWKLRGNLSKKHSDDTVGENWSLLEARKTELYHAADSFFQEAIAIGKSNEDTDLMTFYVDWIINATRFPDSTYFWQSMDALKAQFPDNAKQEAHYARLLGYYYYGIDMLKAIQHYAAFLEVMEEDRNVDYRNLAECFYILRASYREIGDFEKSAFYAKKSFLLYDCMSEEVEIAQVENIQQIDSTKRYCLIISGFYAEGLLQKYQQQKKPEDLRLANAYFDFIERHSFRSLLNRDEGAFLSFQLEAGSRIYTRALESAYEAWVDTKDRYWLDKSMGYMEYLKSYLLYRDMLKNDEGSGIYSLSDSIRLLQGKVNQLLFTAGSQDEIAMRDASKNNLINKLSQLENRRVSDLSAFESSGYISRISLDKVRRDLSERQGVVNYYNGGNQLFGLYLDQDTTIFFQLQKGYQQFTEAIHDYRASIEEEVKLDKETIDKYLGASRTLYKSLIVPFAGRLDHLDQLLVIPDRVLDPVPFEAFLTEDPDTAVLNFKELPYLLHQVGVVYTSAWKVYRANRKKIMPNFAKASLGFWTTPELSTVNGLDLIEKSIQTNFGENYQVFNQRKGGKALFQKHHPRFQVLHLLLHASSNRINRYDNQIKFGADQEDQVYGFELYQEKFKAKLAVLASCESAAGAPQSGEGTFSLARSFINSGIPEIIAAQFLIPQTTTGPLLSYFYQHLANGYSTPASLHQAKIDFLKNVAKERHAYPRFWAGMVAYN